jgi:dolichol kinase
VVERRTLIRRGFHMLSSLFVVYYWLPPYLDPVALTRDQVALLGLFVLTSFEAYRIHRGWLFFGLRDYEKRRVAGYYWGAFGYVIALLLFPQRFAMITILGTTLTDPVLGELRKRGRKRTALAAGLAVWTAIALSLVALVPLPTPVLLVPVGAALAVAAEWVKVPHLDDNFLMNLVPLVAMTALAALAGL